MESANIAQLLEAYFEGNTTLEQENVLREYFTSKEVAKEHECYIPLFKGLQVAKEEQMVQAITFPKQEKSTNRRWWIGIAASAILVLAVSSYVYNDSNTLSQEQQEALMAFNESKEALFLLSKSLNKGSSALGNLNEFTNTTDKYFK